MAAERKTLRNLKNVSLRSSHLFGEGTVTPQESPTFVFLIGSPGVGKTTSAKHLLGDEYDNMYKVSLDTIIENYEPYFSSTKQMSNSIREFRKTHKSHSKKLYSKKNYGKFSGLYLKTFREVDDFFDKALKHGIDMGYSILYDTTFNLNKDGRVAKYDKIIDYIQRKNPRYHVRVILVQPDGRVFEEQKRRIQKQLRMRVERAIEEDDVIRPVNPRMAAMFIMDNNKAFEAIRDPDYFDKLRIPITFDKPYVVKLPEHIVNRLEAIPDDSDNSDNNLGAVRAQIVPRVSAPIVSRYARTKVMESSNNSSNESNSENHKNNKNINQLVAQVSKLHVSKLNANSEMTELNAELEKDFTKVDKGRKYTKDILIDYLEKLNAITGLPSSVSMKDKKEAIMKAYQKARLAYKSL
jgi:tRNA uridine 5-carbamoylmethylation protein Kti12